jgi:hypothetical protein
MRKLLIATISLALATSASAGLFSTVSGMTMEEIKPQQSYTVDTAGINPRIYQFVPKGISDYICIAMFTNSTSKDTAAPALQCVKVK